MEDSSSHSNCTDKEDSISESKSNLSLSVGYFPYEDTIACEDTTTCEDLTSEVSFTHFLPPVQGTQKTERIRNPMMRQDEVQDNPKRFCKQTIALVLDADMGSDHEDSLANWDLSGDNPRMKRPVWRQNHSLDNPEKLCKLTITLIMDIHTGFDHEDPLADGDLNRDNQRMAKCSQENIERTLCKLEDVMQMLKAVVENQKDDKHFGTVLFQSPQEEDLHPSSSILLHMYQMISQVTGTIETPLVSAEQLKEGDSPSHTETTSYMKNLRSVFYWLRKMVVSSLPGRKHPERATKSPSLLEPKKRHFLRSKRIQPQESLE